MKIRSTKKLTRRQYLKSAKESVDTQGFKSKEGIQIKEIG